MAKQKATKRKMGPREANQAAYEKFVALWNGAKSKGDVIAKSGLSESKVNAWAYRLRKNKVELQKFKNSPRIDFASIAAVAKKALKS